MSIVNLQAIGALTKNEKITELGHELLKYPLDIYNARMLYASIENGTVGNVLPMVAILDKR
jgi:HrpA-like RNA helicase